MSRPRAPKIAPPGAQRVELVGILAAPDDFGRPHLLLLDKGPADAASAAFTLRRELPENVRGDVPYSLKAGALEPYDDEVRGRVWFVRPQRQQVYWSGEIARLRGRWVKATASVRGYNVRSGDVPRVGVSLCLSAIEEVAGVCPQTPSV